MFLVVVVLYLSWYCITWWQEMPVLIKLYGVVFDNLLLETR